MTRDMGPESAVTRTRRSRGRDQFSQIEPSRAPVRGLRRVSDERALTLPHLITADDHDADLVTWIESCRTEICALAQSSGAVLFRGFRLESPAAFRRAAAAFGEDLLDYDEPSSPRTKIAEQLYTSTEYPATARLE